MEFQDAWDAAWLPKIEIVPGASCDDAIPHKRTSSLTVIGSPDTSTGSARTFWRVAVPLARTGLSAGAALGWARAVGEFGATIIFAGSLAGITRTAPIEIYVGLADNLDAGLATAAVLIAASAGVLLSVKLLSRGRSQRFTPI